MPDGPEGQEPVSTGAGEGLQGTALLDREPVADGAAPVADAPAFDPTALTTLDSIRQLADQFPALREFREQGFEAGRQRRDAELRRDLGSVERAKQHTLQVAQRIANGESPEDVAKEVPLYVKANEDTTRADLMRALIEQAIPLADDQSAQTLRRLADGLEGKPEELLTVAQASLEAALARAKRQGVDEIDLDALPAEHPIRKWADARVQRETETELNAREIAAKQPENAPRTPSGTPSADGLITPREFVNMGRQAQERYLDTLDPEQTSLFQAKLMEAAPTL